MDDARIEMRPSRFVPAQGPYSRPGTSAPIEIKLDSNEGPAPPADLLNEAYASVSQALNRYPDDGPLTRRIADMLGVGPEAVLVTAGADDALERAARSVLEPGRELVLPVPTFEMLRRYAAMTGCDIVEVPWLEGPYPVDRVLAAVNERTAAIAVVSPNNPTGLACPADDLERLARSAPSSLVILDAAYAEFAEEDLTAVALGLENVVAIRSMSKAWGLAGLRVGFAVGRPEVMRWMRSTGHPYSVSSLSLELARARLDQRGQVERYVARVRRERAELASLLERLGARPVDSQANFVLCRFKRASWVRDCLAGMGIGVRSFPEDPLLDGCLRISLPGDQQAFKRLKRAIETVLSPQALLFDMDDTLVDTSRSYRRAIVETARHFGVAVTEADVSRMKAQGGANDDWDLTRRLVAMAGKEKDLETIKERFESLYQGDRDRPGLKQAEALMVDRSLLEALAQRLELGIVTGRPRADAMDFLERNDLLGLFKAVVTRDDAPLKPDPAPVRLAMERLGADRAWMVGDTPDDVRAARQAGALPIGVVAPSDDPGPATRAMLEAGAGRVLSRLDELKEVIP